MTRDHHNLSSDCLPATAPAMALGVGAQLGGGRGNGTRQVRPHANRGGYHAPRFLAAIAPAGTLNGLCGTSVWSKRESDPRRGSGP